MVKNLPANAGNIRYLGSVPGLGRFPWRREWLPTAVYFPGKSHEQGSLAGYSPWGCKESDMTEQLTLFLSIVLLVLFEGDLVKPVRVCLVA